MEMYRNSPGASLRCILQFVAMALVVALGYGCSSQVPALIRKSPDGNPALQAVKADIHAFLGRSLRWGGKIAEVENLASTTQIAVVGLPLQRKGRPLDSGKSDGRFLASIPGFIDPEIYREGRLLTVFGQVSGETEREIGKYRYRYPVVTVEAYYLWSPEVYYPYYYDPVLRDPFFYDGPYYPYGPFPYY